MSDHLGGRVNFRGMHCVLMRVSARSFSRANRALGTSSIQSISTSLAFFSLQPRLSVISFLERDHISRKSVVGTSSVLGACIWWLEYEQESICTRCVLLCWNGLFNAIFPFDI